LRGFLSLSIDTTNDQKNMPQKTKVVRLSQIIETYDKFSIPSHARSGENRFLRENEFRRPDSALRARRMVRWLSVINADPASSYFFTATFADDIKKYEDALARWQKFRRILQREFPLVRYIAVPEVQPRSGRWHFHAIFCGIGSTDEMRARYGKMIARSGRVVDAWQFRFTKLWSKANGGKKTHRCSIELARSVAGVCSYLSKYLVKDVGGTVPVGRRNYYAGGKFLRIPKIEEVDVFDPPSDPSFEAHYTDAIGRDIVFRRYNIPQTSEPNPI